MKAKRIYALLDIRDTLSSIIDDMLKSDVVCIKTYRKAYMKLYFCETLLRELKTSKAS